MSINVAILYLRDTFAIARPSHTLFAFGSCEAASGVVKRGVGGGRQSCDCLAWARMLLIKPEEEEAEEQQQQPQYQVTLTMEVIFMSQ